MSRIPEEKIPYVNSIGEQFRARQLLLQLPPQDSDFKHCHDMSEEERNELKLFQAQRRRDALGRGTVRLIPETVEGVTGLCQQVCFTLFHLSIISSFIFFSMALSLQCNCLHGSLCLDPYSLGIVD